MNKKFISSVLAGACALSMTSIAAFAADETAVASEWGTDGNFVQPVTVDSSIKTPTLKVTVPTSATVIVNPYKIAVTLGGDTLDDTIISPEYEIKNESDCGVTVTVTAGAKVKDATNKDVTISAKPLKGTETKKTTFMYVEATTTQGSYREEGYMEKAEKADKNADAETIAAVAAKNAYMDRQMVLATKEASKDLIKLDANGGDNTSAWFKIQGSAASNTATPWNVKDVIDVTLSLKIAPAANGAGEGGETPPAGFTADVAADDITIASPGTLGALVANNTYAVAYDGGLGGNVTPAFTGYTVTDVTCATASGSGITYRTSDARFSCQADGTYDLVIELKNDSDNTDTPTITLRITASDC